MLQCRVALGKSFKTHQASPHFEKPPLGYQSVNSLPGIEFEDEEYVIYDKDAAYAVHLIAYTHEGPASDVPASRPSYGNPSDRVLDISDQPSTRHESLSGTDTAISSSITLDSLPPYSTLPGAPYLIPDYSPPLDPENTLRVHVIHTQMPRSTLRLLSGDNFASSPLEMVSDDGGPPFRRDTGPTDFGTNVSADSGALHSSPQSSGHSNRSQRSIQFTPHEMCSIHHQEHEGDEGSRSDVLCTDSCVGITRLINRMQTAPQTNTPRSEIEIKRQFVHSIFAEEGDQSSLVQKGERDPQVTLDVVQEMLDDANLWSTVQSDETEMIVFEKLRDRLVNSLLKLSSDSGLLPSSLFLKGIDCPDRESTSAGVFADVYQGNYKGRAVALKRLRVYQMVDETEKGTLRKAFHYDSLVWRNLSHPHVLPFLGIDDIVFKNSLCMILPWMPHGSIRDAIKDLRASGTTTDQTLLLQLYRWLTEIAQGLTYLHEKDIVHADLRGPNILIDLDQGARLTDFGMSKFAEGVGQHGTFHGDAIGWMAPELIDSEPNGSLEGDLCPTFASDIYSFGCTVIEVFTDNEPFFGIPDSKVLLQVPEGLRPSRPIFADGLIMSDELWNLTEFCWDGTPSARPTAQKVSQAMELIYSQTP